MLISNTISLLISCLLFCGCAQRRALSWDSNENRFMQHPAVYYSELAHACDTILQATPLETNALYQVSPETSSLPKIILDLHPNCLWVSWDSVSVDFGQGNDGFWVGWGPDRNGTNTHVWTLVANVQGEHRILYSENRH